MCAQTTYLRTLFLSIEYVAVNELYLLCQTGFSFALPNDVSIIVGAVMCSWPPQII